VPRAFPHQLAWLLNNPVRGLLLSPRTLLSRIPLQPTDRIVELGPGSGYFSLALSAAVPRGHLELIDLQPQMLAKARQRLTEQGRSNVSYTVADAGNPLPLAEAGFDVAVLVHVLGEVEDQAQCLRSLTSALKPGGVLALHEGVPDPDRIPIAKLAALVGSHGFYLDRIEGPGWNYTALFRRAAVS
jgi:ubiquinone/menaquinone biosynthesis C-methylase UbiE